ncbi:dienelactone hydrolase family protein [Actinacidiphila alni]|uniref:dienelactone hydrolase family protein n=1 Tax=Actinacidiphila alni TaxID=380248 RepID=UPI0034530A89
MTTFILVAGAHTGGWIWQETAERLRAAGAAALPAALTGLDAGPGGGGAPPGTDLETHIADVLALIDGADPTTESRDLVLVGHDYGIHPVLGAAGRRPERVARVVHLDTGIPRDGDPPLALIQDAGLRESVTSSAGPLLPPPSADDWPRYGSTAGVPPEALARLAERAVPQPRATLTQPLRLTGSAPPPPTTGVLCTGNGSSIALVESLVGLGDPRFAVLAAPHVDFLDLATGHWPMLSDPAGLADVLLRAAAGEGHHLVPRKPGQQPAPQRPFPVPVPEHARERHGDVDLHLPADTQHPAPAVLLVHGGPVPEGVRPTPRDWPSSRGYAQLLASRGVVGAVVDHRLHDITDFARAADDVAAAVALLRADPRVDPDRVALWFFSAGGLLSTDWLAAPPPWLRCVALTYPVLDPLPNWGLSASRFHPAPGPLPVVLTRAGREHPAIATTVTAFLTAARTTATPLDLVDAPEAHHAFESTDPPTVTRPAILATTTALLRRLTAAGGPDVSPGTSRG